MTGDDDRDDTMMTPRYTTATTHTAGIEGAMPAFVARERSARRASAVRVVVISAHQLFLVAIIYRHHQCIVVKSIHMR